MDQEDKKEKLRQLKRKAKFIRTIFRNGEVEQDVEQLFKEVKDEIFKTGVFLESRIDD